MSEVADTVVPRLAAKARLKWDEVRQKPMLLFPEGVLILNDTAKESLSLCDGVRTVAEIVDTLVERYVGIANRESADDAMNVIEQANVDKVKSARSIIDRDMKELLAQLIDKGLITLAE